MATMEVVTDGVPPSSAGRSEPDGPERQPDGRRLIANRPRLAAVKCTYGPSIRAIFDKWYGLVHNTEQRVAASLSSSEPNAAYHADPRHSGPRTLQRKLASLTSSFPPERRPLAGRRGAGR